jgi:outer membrane receptor for ferrienterochelin and colicin
VRLTYSKRVDRAPAYYLNPDVPTSDSLNRTVGNPSLGPKYTHSYSFDAIWNGSRGTLRLSPYLRETVDNWDQVTRVNASGAATTTYMNASSSRFMGLSLTGSLRQTGCLGGTLGLGAFRQRYDASNIGTQFLHDVTGWSANGNVSFKATERLDLQSWLSYSPASALPQGHRAAFFNSSLTLRQKFGEKAWASLSINDPFDLSRSSSTTGDATYEQESRSNNRARSISGSFTWTWGKPPEEKQRRQSAEQPQADAPTPAR